jgi:hypothetical protein
MSAVAPSIVALSTTKPPGTSADGFKRCRMMLIPPPNPGSGLPHAAAISLHQI